RAHPPAGRPAGRRRQSGRTAGSDDASATPSRSRLELAHERRSALDRAADARIGTATAKVADPGDVRFRRRTLARQQIDRGHDLTRLAVAALGDIMLDPR